MHGPHVHAIICSSRRSPRDRGSVAVVGRAGDDVVPRSLPMAATADRNLLFGLLALQNGLINQVQLVAAFQAWTLDKAHPLADHLVGRGDLDADDRSAVEALVARHIKKHGGDVERSLAAIPAGRSTRESLARIDDPDVGDTLARLGSRFDPARRRPHRHLLRRRSHLRRASGSASCGPTPGAAWAPSSWRWTPSCIARWR